MLYDKLMEEIKSLHDAQVRHNSSILLSHVAMDFFMKRDNFSKISSEDKVSTCKFIADSGEFVKYGKLEKSMESFSTLLGMKGQGHAMASYFFGLINQFLGNDKEAEEGFRILRGASRQSLIANFYLAQLKLKHNRHEEALELVLPKYILIGPQEGGADLQES